MGFSEIAVYDCTIFIVIISACIFHAASPRKNRYQNNLTVMGCAIAFAFIMDIIIRGLAGDSSASADTLRCVCASLRFVAYAAYAYTWIRLGLEINLRRGRLVNILLAVCTVFLAVELALIIVNAFTGWFFSVTEDGVLRRGTYYLLIPLCYIFIFISEMLVFADVAVSLKKQGKRKGVLLFTAYALMPVYGGVMSVAFNDFECIWGLAAVSWMLLEVTAGKREIELRDELLYEASRRMNAVYYKIYEVDVAADAFKIIKSDDPGQDMKVGFEIRGLNAILPPGSADLVCAQDREGFREFISRENFVEFAEDEKTAEQYLYRRKTGTAERWVIGEMLKSTELSRDGSRFMLYFRDVDDVYDGIMREKSQLLIAAMHDVLTGIRNARSYRERYDCLAESGESAGVLFADLNSLKSINDVCGHEEGDKYIKWFSDMLVEIFGRENCYRIGGDEFVVISVGVEKSVFDEQAERLRRKLSTDMTAIASFGTVYCEDTRNISDALKEAERRMYEDKSSFYRGRYRGM